MTFNKTRFVFATLVICATGALVGSISSTIAWYQYSTRATAAYLGASANTGGNLRLRIKGTNTWLNDLTYFDVEHYLESVNKGQLVTPITSGPMNADDAIRVDDDNKMVFYQNPDSGVHAQRVDYDGAAWRKADESMYVSLPLELCYRIANDGSNENGDGYSYLEKDVYISDLLIQGDWRNGADPDNLKRDLSTSIRVHISTYQSDDESENHQDTAVNRLISKNGGTILTEGYLDLDGDGDLDEYITGPSGANYHFGNEDEIERHYTAYGSGVQNSYSNKYNVENGSYKTLANQEVEEKVYPSVVETIAGSNTLKEESFEFIKEGDENPTSKSIGKTVAFENSDDEAYLNVVMTIWIEGWEPLSTSENNPDDVSPIWSPSDYIGSMFDVGIEFAVQTDK